MAGFIPGTARFALKHLPVNEYTDDHTLALVDDGAVVELNKATAVTLTIPANSAVGFKVTAQVLIRQKGAGQVTVSPAAGVTLDLAGGEDKSSVENSMAALLQVAMDTWVLSGDLTS